MNDFTKELQKIHPRCRCLQTSGGSWNMPLNHVRLGVRTSEWYGWTTFDSLPNDCCGFHFYFGGSSVNLLSAFIRSEFAKTVEYLSIGNSSDAIGKSLGHEFEEPQEVTDFDFSKVISAIEHFTFPKLKSLRLGIWELLCNAHCMYGKLGDITTVLINNHHIEELEISGVFELIHPIELPNLKTLTIIIQDIYETS